MENQNESLIKQYVKRRAKRRLFLWLFGTSAGLMTILITVFVTLFLILAAKKGGTSTDELENCIDQYVYSLYGLDPSEIRYIESQ